MRVMLLHNPTAGDNSMPSGDALVRLIEGWGHTVAYRSTADPGWRGALQDAGDLVAVAGGDGTVAAVLRSLGGSDIPATVLPLGTANNIASTLGIAGPPDEVVPAWSEYRLRPFDLGCAAGLRPDRDTRFVEAIGVGALTEMIGTLDGDAGGLNAAIRRYEGLPGYVALLRRMLERRSGEPLDVRVDGEDVSGHILMLEVLNIGMVGPRLRLGASSDPGDGRLDVLIIHDHEREVLLAYLDAQLDGGLWRPPLPTRAARRVEVSAPGAAPLPIRRDDAVRRVSGPVSIEVHAGALQVLAPA